MRHFGMTLTTYPGIMIDTGAAFGLDIVGHRHCRHERAHMHIVLNFWRWRVSTRFGKEK